MEFRDLKSQYEELKDEIDAGIFEVIHSSHFISGMQVEQLEARLADYVGVKHCVTCANGTDALTLALMTWNIGAGDAVFVPDFTFFSSAEVVAYSGAYPVFVDVYEDTYNISVEDLERKIEETLKKGQYTPRVIVTVDLFGQPAEYPRLKAIAEKYGLLILEDSAQGFGGNIEGKKACSFGDIATTSFFPAKPLGCYGDGGAIFTDNDEWADYLRSLRIHGKGNGKYDNIRIGMNSRLDTLQAAILLPKLKAFQLKELQAVNKVACLYSELLRGYVGIPKICEGYVSSWAQYTIRLRDGALRRKVQDALKEQGIPTMVYYEKTMSQQKAFDGFGQNVNPIAGKLCNTVLSLPMHPYLNEEQIEMICKKLLNAVEGT